MGTTTPVGLRCGVVGKPNPLPTELWCGGHNMGLQCGNHEPIGIGAWKSQTRWGGVAMWAPETQWGYGAATTNRAGLRFVKIRPNHDGIAMWEPQRQPWCGICNVLLRNVLLVLLVSPSPTELWCWGHNMGLQHGNHKPTGSAACKPHTRWGCNMDPNRAFVRVTVAIKQ